MVVRMRWKWIGIAVFVAACAAHQETDSAEARCSSLRDHLVDLRIREVRGPAAGLDLEAHRSALRRALGSSFVDTCAAHMSDAQITCALSATTLRASTECGEGSASHVAEGDRQ